MTEPIFLMSINMGLVIVGTLPAAVASAAYSAALSAINGIEPYAWGLANSSEALPSGLSITTDSSGDGIISGTPTTAGTYPVQILVTDARGISAARNFRIWVQ